MNQSPFQSFKRLAAIFAFLLYTLPFQAAAARSEDIEAEDIFGIAANQKVVVASKREEKIEDAPGVISIVTEEDIRRFGAITLVDVLDRLTAIYPIGSNLFRDNVAAIRGDFFSHNDVHTLVLLNGRPYRSSMSARDALVYTAFPLDSIHHIEIIRGPGSVLYGTDAFQGVINIITKEGKAKPEIKASASMGNFGTEGANALVSAKVKDFSFQVGTQYNKSTGWPFEAYDETLRSAAGTVTHPSRKGSADYGRRNIGVNFLSSYKNLKANVFYAYENNTILGTAATWPEGGQIFSHLIWDLGYDQPLSENWDASINVTSNIDQMYNENDVPVGGSSTYVKHRSRDYLTELSVRGKMFNDFNIVFGGVSDYQQGLGDIEDPAGPSPVAPYVVNWWSGYIQADYRPIEKLKLIAGAQINAPQNLQAHAVPRFGAIFNFTSHLGTKLLYGEAYRSAFATERSIVLPGALFGNPSLEPEKVATTDLNVFYNTEKTQTGLTYFFIKQKDLITRIPRAGGGSTYINRAEFDVQGVEFETKFSPIKNLFVTGSYSHQENKDSNGLQNTSLLPNNMVKGGVSYDWPRGITIGAFDSYYSKRYDVILNNAARTIVNPDSGEYHWVTANLALNTTKLLNVGKRFDVILNLYGVNLMDYAVYEPENNRKTINTLPGRTRAAYYLSLIVKY